MTDEMKKMFGKLRQQAQAELERKRDGRICIWVDTGSSGAARGATEVVEELRSECGRHRIGADILAATSLGWNEVEPVVAISVPGNPIAYYGNVTVAVADELAESLPLGGVPRPELALAVDVKQGCAGLPWLGGLPFFAGQHRDLLRTAGTSDPEDVNDALARGAYVGLLHALSLSTEEVIALIEHSSLRLRHSGQSAAVKWKACHASVSESRYVVAYCAGGTGSFGAQEFLLENGPHAVLEGLLIAAYASGARHAILCVDGNASVALRRCRLALDAIHSIGLAGESILGSEFGCQIEIRQVSSELCRAEDTILLSALEGRQPQTRVRPPHPETEGVFGLPTVVQDVESLAAVAAIFQVSPSEAIGCTNTTIVRISGALNRTGFVEVPFGTPLRTIVEQIAGGAKSGTQLKALQVGSATGGWLPAADLDLTLDGEALQEAGYSLGAGALTAVDTGACAVTLAHQAASKAHEWSCCKCSFGREGTRQLMDVLRDLMDGRGKAGDIELLLALGDAMQAGSLCDNGRQASEAVLSTIRHFRSEYDAHVKGGVCLAHL